MTLDSRIIDILTGEKEKHNEGGKGNVIRSGRRFCLLVATCKVCGHCEAPSRPELLLLVLLLVTIT